MARQTPINTADDMRWLRDVHLPRLPAKYKSAIIVGNEDYPDRIEVYESRDPRVTDVPVVYKADAEGVFKDVAGVHHATRKTAAKQLGTSTAKLDREIAEALVPHSAKGDRVLADLKSWGIDRALVDEVRSAFGAGDHRRAMALARDLGWNRAAKRGRAR